MTILVDTPIWSLVYRRKRWTTDDLMVVDELRGCIEQDRAMMIGPVRQEVLSGLRDPNRIELLRTTLRAFEDLPIQTEDYERAAMMYSRCRAAGIQGSHTDFLICAVSRRYDAAIFTTDRDFSHYARHLDIALHSISP